MLGTPIILFGSQLVLLILSGNLLWGTGLVIAVAIGLVLMCLRGWKNKAARFEHYYELVQQKRDELTATNKLLHSDHHLLVHITANYALLTEIIAGGGQVVGAGLVSAAAPAPSSHDTSEKKHLGSSENVFNPPPLCRVSSKLERHEQVMALVITDEAETSVTEGTKFNVVVCYPQEALQKAASPNCTPLQQLHTWALIEVIRCEKEKYKIDIPRTAYQSRGAMALAMRYVIDRARREGAREIYGSLTHFGLEAHRVRLYCFYIKKFGFTHTPLPGDGYGIVQKFL